jgi:hypothetical protein
VGSDQLIEADWELVGNKTEETRLGFAVILKFYEFQGRFPAYGYAEEVPQSVNARVDQFHSRSSCGLFLGISARLSFRSFRPIRPACS